jgi:hypothetical protein
LPLILSESLWLLRQVVIFCKVTRHVPPYPTIQLKAML